MSTVDSLTIAVETQVSGGLARRVAELTSAAYRSGDLVPGLPVADGAKEDAAGVLADLDGGHRLWTATAGPVLLGTVRALPDGRAWSVRRLAVSPRARRLGVGRRLLRAIEADALAAGASHVVLDAVVERGNPVFYTSAGYRSVRHFAASDKPLSEVHMERVLTEPVPSLTYPDAADLAASPPGLVRSWWEDRAAGVVRVTGPAPDGVSAGLDRHRALAGAAVLRGVDWAPGAAPGPDTVERLPGRAGSIPAYAQPRLGDPEFLAWWRLPARG